MKFRPTIQTDLVCTVNMYTESVLSCANVMVHLAVRIKRCVGEGPCAMLHLACRDSRHIIRPSCTVSLIGFYTNGECMLATGYQFNILQCNL